MLPHLLSPIRIGPLELPNRVLMGSMHTGLEEQQGGWERLAAFYAERAGVGLIITGGVAPDLAGRAFPRGAVMDEASLADHGALVSRVHQAGGRIALQLLHAGRYAFQDGAVAPSALAPPMGGRVPRELTHAEILQTIRAFGEAAVLAGEAGYDGVEIMGSEGYLLTQFLAPRTNHRTDTWGGSATARRRFAVEVARAVRQGLGPGRALLFRLSLLDLVEEGSTWGEVVLLARELEAVGVDAFNSGIGWHEARVPTIASVVPEGAFTWVTEHLRTQLRAPIAAVNRISTPELAEEVLATGQADLVSVARPLLADPEWLSKAAAGCSSEIVPCVACNQACLDRIFKLRPISCLTNPRAGRETEFPRRRGKPAGHLTPRSGGVHPPRGVAVVGAGPAGLSAATTLAERGVAVTLYEARPRVGGMLRLAARIPGKRPFLRLLSFYEREVERLGVDLRLSTRPSVAELSGFDEVVVATGTRPREVEIPGAERPEVLTWLDVLEGAEVGEQVALVGAGGVGFDLAALLTDPQPDPDPWTWLEQWGVDLALEHRGGLRPGGPRLPPSPRQLWLLQRRRGEPGRVLGPTTGWIHRLVLRQRGVHLWGGVRYERIDDQGLHVIVEGEPRVLPVDQVVICAGQRSCAALDERLQGAGLSVHLLGGARDARRLDAERAIREGVELGLRLV